MPRYIRYYEEGQWKYASIKDVGDISQLKTSNKSDVVSAINELIDGGIAEELKQVQESIKNQAETIKSAQGLISAISGQVTSLSSKEEELRGKVGTIEGKVTQNIEDYKNIKKDLENKVDGQKYQDEYAGIVEQLKDKANSIDVESIVKDINDDVTQTQIAIDKANTGVLELDYKTKDLQNKIKDNKAELDKHGGTLTTIKTDVDTVKGQYSVQAETLSNLGGKMTDATAKIEANSKAITSKVERTEFDTLSGNVSTQGTEISQMSEAIKLKAEKKYIDDGLGNKLDTKTYTDKMAEIDVSVNGIKQTVQKTTSDLGTLGGKVEDVTQQVSTIDQKANEISTSVKEIKGNVDTLGEKVSTQETSIKQNAESIKAKAEKKDMDTLSGKVTDAQAQIKLNAEAIEQTVKKTEYEEAVGLNKWIASRYDITGTDLNQTAPAFALIQGKRPTEVIEFNDSQMLVAFPATDNVITHYFTNIYLKERKTVTLNVKYDDSLAIYMNGAKIFENKSNGMQAVKVAFGFNKGWNTVEILQGEKDGGETLDLGLKLSTQVDKLTAYIGVGDKDDTRLIETETSLKQTKESIKMLAEKKEVTELGNKITDTQASLEVTNNAIKSKVEQKDFDAYSDKVTKAETSIEQLSESITQKVEKKEYDSLNNIVKDNSTQIEQLKDSIVLKVDQKDFNGMNDRITDSEVAISLNTDQILLKAEKKELDKTTGRITDAEAKLKVMSDEISLTVKKKDFDAVNQDVRDSISMIEQNAESIKLSVTETNSKIDGLQVGSRNYIAKSAEEVVLENNVFGQSKGVQKQLVSDALEDLRNSEIVLSFYAKTTNIAHGTAGNNSVGIELSLTFEDGTQSWYELCYSKVVAIGSTSGYVRYDSIKGKRKYKIPDKPIKSGYLNVLLRDATGKIQIKSVQLERGNKLTDFNIAQEDLTGSIGEVSERTSSVEQTANSIKQSVETVSKTVTEQGTKLNSQQTAIETMDKAIKVKAEATNVYSKTEADNKTNTAIKNAKAEINVTTEAITQNVTNVKKDVDGMKTTVESQGTQIKQTADDIALNVVKNDKVISSINASKEGIKISAPKLDIKGAVSFESLDSSMKDKVSAGADAKNQIDGMQFGGKNIIRKRQIVPINVASSSYDEATNTWTLTANSGAGGSWGAGVRVTDKTSVVPIGSWFAVSFEIFSPIDANWNADVNNFPVTGTSTTNDNDDTALRKTSNKSLKANTWTKCWFTWKNRDNSTTDLYDQSNIGLVNNSGSPVTFKIRNVKGELGNVVTDYSLAQEDVDEMINSISFGGRNIFLNAGLLQGSANWYSNVAQTTVVADGEDQAFKFTPNSGAGRAGIYQRLGGGISANKVFEKDQYYTVSVMMKASTGSHKLHIGAESIDVKTVDVDTTWREYSHTFKGTGEGNGTIIFYTTALANGVDFFIKRMQLEKGNRKTDFTLAPEDYDKLLSDVNKKAQDSQNAIDNMSIGGNNLLLNSHADYSTTEYQIATYTLTENWVAGQEYTFVIKGTVPAGQKFGIWMNGGSSNVGYATTKYSDGVTYVTFKAVTPAGGHTKALNLYNYPSNTTASTVDWVALYKGNKPMDWTISSGDIQNLFTGVDEKAEASKKAIADMSNDNKATPIEKQQLKKEWATITAEKPNYEALATTYGITTEKTNYVNAYNALNTAIAPIISNASATSDINGTIFRNTFDDYYDKKAQLVKKINELARTIGTDANSKAQSAQDSIADMSSDSKITPVEKVQLKKEWAVMVAEKPQFEALANGFGVTGEKNNYVNAYNTLNTALNGSGGILTNMTTTSSVNGATFRAQFDDYYDRKSQLVRKINELSKVLTQGLNGKVLYSDPMFKNGLNDVKVYNNSANSNVTINRVTKPSDAPTNSTHVLEVKSLALPISPSYGGFSFQTMSRANAIFITRIVAKIPVGSKLVFASNSTGTGGKSEWLTPVAGTGKWEEYLFRLECGSTGTFSSTNFFNLEGGTLPLTWHIAYATVIDATDYDYSITDMSNDNKLTPLEKQQLKKEWATISAEKPQYEALSNTFGITTEKTNYVNSYNALNTLLSPLIANIAVTSDVNGQTFRNTFDDYYDKKAQLVRKINELSRSIGTGADTKAQQAKDSIADMSSDSKITPVEKVQLKKEWAVMASEKPQYEVLAATYGIGAEKTNFVNAYNTLNTVLNGTGGILTNMTTTSAITGATFRGQFDDYYDKKSQLVKVINEKAKLLADNAQGTANGVNNTVKPWIFPNKTTINGGQIETGSVKAVQIDVANLFANTAFINNLKTQTVSADKISGGTIKGVRYESINASNSSIKLVLEGNTVKSYGALSNGSQSYAELKEGRITVFEVAENGSPFGDRKAFVEPARFNAQQGSRSGAYEANELRFWAGGQLGRIALDVVGEVGGNGYGLHLEANGGVFIKNTSGGAPLQFESQHAIYFDAFGNIKMGKYAGSDVTWGVVDKNGRNRLVIPMGDQTWGSNQFMSHGGGNDFWHNGYKVVTFYQGEGGQGRIMRFGDDGGMLKWWNGGKVFEFKNSGDNGFHGVIAQSFTNASSYTLKTNIEKYDKSALDSILGTDIMTYKYKSDVEDDGSNAEMHVGVLSEYAPDDITREDKKSVDLYAMVALSWKAIQELSEQVRYLKRKLNNR
ncbi:tail fiber domain-containing protein [Bacillus cereus]|uniref:tail fiber domain-containing protein n=1 Tax=Bacillus cereus TaxID=1396 RepID=UPI00363D925E